MAEFRNEAKAAQQFVDKTLDQQRNLEQQTRTTPRSDYARLGEQEKQLQQSLTDFEQQHPRAFKGTQAEAQQTQDAMTKAAESLAEEEHGRARRHAAGDAAVGEAQRGHEERVGRSSSLRDAYKLKQMLDKQIQTFGKCANPGAGGAGLGRGSGPDGQRSARDDQPAQEGRRAGADARCVWPALARRP